MSLFTILGTLFLGPLKLVFEIIFGLANSLVSNPGLAIIFLSLAMNILVLPLYKRADAMQEAARDVEAKLAPGVNHIKKTFSGDERMMILQTYYKQNNHSPLSALNGSVSLLLEIPFFMAAYQFLSHLEILNGVSFGPITNLGAPDGIIKIGGLAINLLPILMTVINVIASAIYLKGFPLKTKIQLYGIAGLFLILLYTSPAGLVFYWTLNNVFSLVKNIFYKIKNPQKVLRILTFAVGIVGIVFGAAFYDAKSTFARAFVICLSVILTLPLIINLVKSKIKVVRKEKTYNPDKKMFIMGGLILSVLMGVLIPSAYISASTLEFIDPTYFHNPMWYIASTTAMSAGFFLVWFGVFYWLASPAGKVAFTRIMWLLSGVAIVNYMFFGKNLGNLSSQLQYDNNFSFGLSDNLINILVLTVVCVLLYICASKWSKVTSTVMLTLLVAVFGLSVPNLVTINTEVKNIKEDIATSTEIPHFNLSKDGENVVVIMLDRALGEYVPYIFNEKPELKEKFDGFTYYSNTLSFGGKTNFASPALWGGYEYTPVELNKRDDESLAEKQNEALKVLPVLFAENGYDVTVCDPTYAGYQWIPDLSIYDEYDNIDAYISKGKFSDPKQKQSVIDGNHRNFFCFSLMRSMPLFMQSVIYDDGAYNRLDSGSKELVYTTQTLSGMSNAEGVSSVFMEPYNVICNMENMTTVTNDGKNNFLFLTNDMTHEPILLQTPDYVPSATVDNTEYDAAHKDRFNVDGKELPMETDTQMIHYHANMAALLRLSEWFDYLRENDVYDNTKIILVSDHGHNLYHYDDHTISTPDTWTEGSPEDQINDLRNSELYFPLLMVKEIGSEGFTTSDDFMTNADVPTLAVDGLVKNPINPFTGKVINSDEKTAHDQFVCLSRNFQVSENNGNTFDGAYWASVSDNIHDSENWVLYPKWGVLKEHADPTLSIK